MLLDDTSFTEAQIKAMADMVKKHEAEWAKREIDDTRHCLELVVDGAVVCSMNVAEKHDPEAIAEWKRLQTEYFYRNRGLDLRPEALERAEQPDMYRGTE